MRQKSTIVLGRVPCVAMYRGPEEEEEEDDNSGAGLPLAVFGGKGSTVVEPPSRLSNEGSGSANGTESTALRKQQIIGRPVNKRDNKQASLKEAQSKAKSCNEKV
ncbi:hypothetical protein TcWFU_010427 [Taenia crassiceps]|uniref:PEST proteolytic signal-containing nuclear protein n=1 Tax=Taenia crassiceps TaxID=6207 RepID=A0ABR4QJA6_9CEST